MAKRQREGTESLVYAYGLLDNQPELYTNEHVAAEVQRQRELWDTLVRLEHEHEERVYQYLDEHSPEYRDSFSELCGKARLLWGLIETKRRERQRTMQKVDNPEIDAAIANANQEWKAAQKAMWTALKAARKEHAAALKALREEHFRRIPACKDSPLYWGNYNRVRQSFDSTLKRVRKQGRNVQFSDPRRDDVCLTVQIQKVGGTVGCSFDDLLQGRFSALKVYPVDEAAWYTTRANRRKLSRTVVTMRVDRAGNTVRAMVSLDRPVPPEARIKSAQLVWRRMGERYVGRLCLTLSMPAVERTNGSTAACGIDMGWRRTDDGGLRVATIADSDGRVDYLELPPDWMSGMDQVERLAQYVDDGLLDIATLLLGRDDLPEPVARAIARWRPGLGAGNVNAQGLLEAVRTLGFTGLPKELCCGVRDWRQREKRCCWYHGHVHLATWRDNLRRKLLLRRREIYRVAAVALAERYGVMAIKHLDLAAIARTKTRDDGQDSELHAGARAQRQRACLHEFRSELEHQAHKRGSRLEVVEGIPPGRELSAARSLLAAVTASGEVVNGDDYGGSVSYEIVSGDDVNRSQPRVEM